VAAAALGLLAGCGGSSSPSGDATLTIYASADAPAFAAGASAELAKHDGQAAGLPVTLVALGDATGGHWDPVRIAENARMASEDSTSIAYLGELEPGATRISEPITGQAGILQISGDEVKGNPSEAGAATMRKALNAIDGADDPTDRASVRHASLGN
jgi:hypothetical protein